MSENGQPPTALTEAATAFQKLVETAIAERNRREKEHAEKLAAASDEEREKIAMVDLPKEHAELLDGLFGRRGPFEIATDQVEKQLEATTTSDASRNCSEDVETAKKASPPMYPQAHSPWPTAPSPT